METPEEIYEQFKADGQNRCAPKYFDLYFGSWLSFTPLRRSPDYNEIRDAVRALYLADKEAKRLKEFKHRNPEKPSGKPAWNRGITMTNGSIITDPEHVGYRASNPIRAYRLLNNWSNDEMARRVGVSKTTLYQWDCQGAVPEHGFEILGSRLGVDFEQPYRQWRKENPFPHILPIESRRERKDEPLTPAQKEFLIDKYRRIGHALIEVEATQRALRNESTRRKNDLQRAINRPGTPLDEMAFMVAMVDRLRNREAVEERKRITLVEDRERTKRALDAIKRDEEIATEWEHKHADELAEFKPDWKLYMGVPIVGDKNEAVNTGKQTEDWATLNVVDSTGHLMLEDAIIAKIDKEREGYFVRVGFNSHTYNVTLLNEEHVSPFADLTERPLDDTRNAHVQRSGLFNATKQKHMTRKSLRPGEMHSSTERHPLGDEWYESILRDQDEAYNKENKRLVRAVQFAEAAKAIREPIEDREAIDYIAAAPIDAPPAPKVLPEGIDPIDLASVIIDKEARAAWKQSQKKKHIMKPHDPRNDRRKKASQR